MHSTFKVLWNTVPAVWNIKVKFTDISLVFGLYSFIHWFPYVLSTVCRMYPKKYISSYLSKVHKSIDWILLGNAWSENCLRRSSDFSKTEFPHDMFGMSIRRAQLFFPTYLFNSAMAWHKSLKKCKVICALRRGRRFWIKNPIDDQSVHVLSIFFSQNNATRRAWV